MRSLIRLLWTVVGLCLIYVFFIGPAVVLADKKIITKNCFEFVYSPLEKAAKKAPSAEKVLESYTHLWKQKTK
jgi:hypothetical protein